MNTTSEKHEVETETEAEKTDKLSCPLYEHVSLFAMVFICFIPGGFTASARLGIMTVTFCPED